MQAFAVDFKRWKSCGRLETHLFGLSRGHECQLDVATRQELRHAIRQVPEGHWPDQHDIDSPIVEAGFGAMGMPLPK